MTTSIHWLRSAAAIAVAGALLPAGLITLATSATAATTAATAAATPAARSASAPSRAAPAARGKSTTGATAKSARKGKATAQAKEPQRPVALVLPEASAEQIDAAGRVYYGVYECEFQQTISIDADPMYPSYVDLHHGKALYIMKPVLSSTGAIRLEDVMADTLMVQIASKSMLLNVNTGHRLVDECVSPGQRAAIEAARLAKLQAAVESAAPAASGATATPTSEITRLSN